MASILFMCKGNICRSPAAEIILKNLRPHWFVFSVATTRNTKGWCLDWRMVYELKRRGYKIHDERRPVFLQEWILEDIPKFDEVHDLHAEGIQDPYKTKRFSDAVDEIEDYIKTIILGRD